MKYEKNSAVIEHCFLQGLVLLELADKQVLAEAKKLLQDACSKKEDPEAFKLLKGVVSFISFLEDDFDNLN